MLMFTVQMLLCVDMLMSQRHSEPRAKPKLANNMKTQQAQNVESGLCFAGKDLIREGLAKPRAKSKPAFASAAANPHPHSSHSHSVAHSLSPIPTQAPALNTPARARDDDADADEERRASGQAASTSGPSSKAPWDHPDPSAFPKSPSRGRGSPPSSPFASITMREPRSSSSLRSHAIPADGPVSQRSDPAPQERRCSVVSSDRVATQKRTGRRRHGSSSAQTAIRKIVTNNADMAADLESADPEHQASAPPQDLPEQRGPDASQHCQKPQRPSALAAACSLDSTRASRTNSASTRRHNVTTHEARKSCNPIAALALNADKPQASSAVNSAASADSDASWRGRQKKNHLRKPGPSAFPQLPHERALQLQSACIDTHSTSPPSPQPPQARAQASDMPQQGPAQTDQLADAMQQRLWRLQMDQVRAEEDQEGGQQHLGRHGGYMQRGGQERLPRRRTTRSLLRGADVQTGDQLLLLLLLFASCMSRPVSHHVCCSCDRDAGKLAEVKLAMYCCTIDYKSIIIYTRTCMIVVVSADASGQHVQHQHAECYH